MLDRLENDILVLGHQMRMGGCELIQRQNRYVAQVLVIILQKHTKIFNAAASQFITITAFEHATNNDRMDAFVK